MTRRDVEFSCAVVVVGLLDGVTGSSRVRKACGPMIGGALAGLVAGPFITDGPALHWPNPDLSYLLIGHEPGRADRPSP